VALGHGFSSSAQEVTASFRRPVRPGDQLRLRCMRRDSAGERWTIAATAQVDGQTAARATLHLAIEEIGRHP
jgi:3-hydroxymyristoyl/3-hydroxydecanoyl-(acyl carrier protein) dehydratase